MSSYEDETGVKLIIIIIIIIVIIIKVYYLIPRKYSTFWRSILMRLYSPVDLTGNVNMIEKSWVGLEPGTSRSLPRRANLSALKSRLMCMCARVYWGDYPCHICLWRWGECVCAFLKYIHFIFVRMCMLQVKWRKRTTKTVIKIWLLISEVKNISFLGLKWNSISSSTLTWRRAI